jgi:hypothetical protein
MANSSLVVAIAFVDIGGDNDGGESPSGRGLPIEIR